MITQLREVRLARQSAQMAEKDHQKPTAPVVGEVMDVAVAVVKRERDSGLACQVFHGHLPGICFAACVSADSLLSQIAGF